MSSTGEQVVLVLCGLIGSGKSSFATALELHFPAFQRCNQDDLGGDRRAVERKAREALSEGFSVCIDRTNFDERQRSTWINIAHEFPNVKVWCLHLTVTKEACAERLATRTNHPTIKSYEQGLGVLEKFSDMFRSPSFDEGFERIFELGTSETKATYTKEEMEHLLINIETSPQPELQVTRLESYGFFRGRGRGDRSRRGRGSKAPRGGRRVEYWDPEEDNQWHDY